MKKQKLPLVSVIMPAYNAGQFLVEAIESILYQTYPNFELIVVNDGSSHETREILETYQHRFPKKFKAFHFKKNRGESKAANFAFRKAKGEFIARMDADDIAHPQRLEKQVRFILAHPEVIVLGTQAQVVNKSGEVIGKKTFPLSHQEIYQNYAIFHPMLHPSCLFRRSLLPNQKQLYENKYEPNDDYYTLFKLLNCGQFANLGQSLLYYRIHSNNKSLQNPKAKFFNSFKIRLAAIKNCGYKPSFKTLVMLFSQLIFVGFLPEKFIVPFYMLVRGINSPARLFPAFSVSLPTFNLRKNFSILTSR